MAAHPVLCALYVAVATGLTVLGVMKLVDGGSHLQRALYLIFWIAWISMWVVVVRRDEPPREP